MKTSKTIKYTLYIVLAILLAILLYFITKVYFFDILNFFMNKARFNTDVIFFDFNGHWKLCAYTLNGIDPYQIPGKDAIIEDIGVIPEYFGTSPWGLLLENIGYAGFMSIDDAAIYYAYINIFLLIIFSYIVFRQFKKITTKNYAIIAVILTVTNLIYYYAMIWGNIGSILAILVLIAIIYSDDNEILSGICLGIAMIKPQLALIVCFGFLLQKRIKPLIIAASIDIVAWVTVSLLTKTSIIQLIKEFMNSNIGGNTVHSGIAELINYFINISSTTAIYISMTIGIIYVIIMIMGVSKNKNDKRTLFITVIASQFWCYQTGTDRFTIMLALYIIIYLVYKSHNIIYRVLMIIVYGLIYFAEVEMTYGKGSGGTSLYEILVIILSPIIMQGLNKIFMNEKEIEVV